MTARRSPRPATPSARTDGTPWTDGGVAARPGPDRRRGGIGPGGGVAAGLRRGLWRAALAVTGGLRVAGQLPDRPCVLVANHASHADTVALLAAVPARRRPVVAAAADYWFDRPGRRLACRTLVGAFPVRRDGGGSADLAEAVAWLAAGRDVIVFPEGSRSRDGEVGAFHAGAARLAAAAGAPLVPVGITGTGELLPVHGRLRRTPVYVQIGQSTEDINVARAAVLDLTARLAAQGAPRPDSVVRQRVAAFAGTGLALLVVAAWAFGEAMVLPILPEFALVVLGLAAPRRVLTLAVVAAAASLAGGAVLYLLAGHGVDVPTPLTTGRMHAVASAQVAERGAAALRDQPLSGIPYKVYAAAAGRAGTGVGPFLVASALARGLRILLVGALIAVVGQLFTLWRRSYPGVVAVFVIVFAAGLASVVRSWR